MISQARAANLNVGVFPIPGFATYADDFWADATLDSAWWQNWFEHYRAFAVHHADLASQTGSQALILGGDWLAPALPGGQLPDGASSSAPADAGLQWKAILTEVRQHFDGRVWWALPYAPAIHLSTPDFLSDADGVYILWSAPLSLEEGASKADLLNRAAQLLDTEVAPLASQVDRPILIALAYPSAEGVKTGCFDDSGQCLPWEAFSQPGNPGEVAVDLGAQSDMYEAMLNAANSRPYVAGLISRGYYPPTLLQDKSASVHGKPAADLLWYWFPRLTGVVR
jgi:hypothetical protein